MIKILYTSLLIVSLLIVSCSSSNDNKSSSKTPLKNTKWILKVLNDTNVAVSDGGKSAFLTLTSQENRAIGSGGCNSFFTTYTVTGKALVFGPVASTEMFCQNAMDTESKFFLALGNTQSYKVDGNNLYLYDSASKTLARLEALSTK